MVIDIFADIVCPWCYIGKRRLERALAQRPNLEAEPRWRPYQLRPGMPKEGLAWPDFVELKFGGFAHAQDIFAGITALGAAEGLDFAFDRIPSAPNTLDAHRLILFAAEREREWAAADALFAAYFSGSRDLSSRDALLAIAGELGFEAQEISAYLASDTNLDAVQASQNQAAARGISGVPYYIIDERFTLSGAQPIEVFLNALDGASAGR